MKILTELQHWRWKPRWMILFSFTTKKHMPTLSLALLFALFAGTIIPIFAIFLGDIFNSFTLYGGGGLSTQDLIHHIRNQCAKVAVLGAVGWVCNAVYFTLFVVFGELQVADARTRLFDGLLEKDQEWFESQQDGTRAFLSCLQSQIHDLQMATSQPLGLVLQYTFRTVASLGLALYTSWSLSLVTLAGIPIFSGIISFLSSKMKSSIEEQQVELTGASKVVTNATSSIDSVKCLNGQKFELQNFTIKIEKAASHYLKQARLNSFQIATIRLMMFGMFVQGFWYGSTLAVSRQLSSGEVLRTFWACLTAAQSIEMVLPQVIVLEKGKVAASALKTVLDDRKKERSTEQMKGSLYPRYCEGDIEVSDLSFSYSLDTARPNLNSVSFFFPAGETTFVIGKSGSGKSTLGQLLARFYLPTSGDIHIDGIPMQTLNVNWIRNNVTYVEQRSILFNESIFMNIAFGRRDYEQIRKEDVKECIGMAMLDNVIDTMPNGIDTCVGQGGNFLSGGQRQRVAIARARLRDTPILILDEPTSALDGTNRVDVTRAIRKWRKGKTTIIITHDMTQILEQDFVYVLDQGSVVQAGYRHELGKIPGNEKLFPCGEKVSSTDAPDCQGGVVAPGEPPGLCPDTFLVTSMDPYGESNNVSVKHERPKSDTPYRSSFLSGKRRSILSITSMNWDFSALGKDPKDQATKSTRVSMYELDDMQKDGTRVRTSRIYDYATSINYPSHDAEAFIGVQSTRHSYFSDKSTHNSKELDVTSLRKIIATVIPNLSNGQRVSLLIGCLCTLCHASATPVFSYCLSQLFQTFYDKNANAMKWALMVLGVAISDGIASFFMHFFLEVCGQAWVDNLRKIAFRRVLDQPRKWFEEEGNNPSQLTACLAQDGEEMRNLVGRVGGFILVAVAITIMAIVWSMIVCWELTLVAIACGPIIYAISRGFDGTSGLWEKRCNEAKRFASEIFMETFSEIRTVRTLTLEPFFHRKYLKAVARCVTIGLRKAGYTGILFGLVECTVMFVSALIFYYGAVLVSSPQFSMEDVITVFSMLLFSIGYASTVLTWVPQISTSQEMGSRLLRLANLPEGASHEHLGTVGIARAAPVRIAGLNFHYPSRPGALVLKDVSITIPDGSCTAIVGRSGSGKSTIAALLLSLYETPLSRHGVPTITLGGIDIRSLHIPTLRSLVSVVSQQPTIFPGTIQANISYGLEEGSPMCTMGNVHAAAKAAGIDDFISSLLRGYYTVIGDGGVGLSGGQAQQLVIARALIRRPQIFIVDEATSSLDPASALVIRETVQKLVAARLGLTVIIITHAREMMEIADNIVVLEQGVVVERGSYSALSQQPGGKLKALIEDESEDT